MDERLQTLLRTPAIRQTNGVPDFLSDNERRNADTAVASDRENAFKNFFKRWPSFYDRLALIVTPIIFTGLTGETFAKKFGSQVRMLNVGSGPTRLHPNAVNVDLFSFSNVDVLAKAENLPFADNVFEAVVCDQVIEHVDNPTSAIREIVRVAKSGAEIYIGAPFLYPLHPSPKDYERWSVEGISRLLFDCDVVASGIAMGPTSGLLVTLASWLALAFSFGINPLRKVLNYVFMILLFPFKYLDLIFARFPGAETLAATIYVVARKR